MSRRLFRGAVAANVVLLAFAVVSIRLGAFSPDAAPASSESARAPVAVKERLPEAAPGPLQVPAPQLQAPPLAPPQPLPVIAPAPPPDPKERLNAEISSAIGASTAATSGVAVEIEGLGRIVERNADALLPPASAQKLQTAGVALLKLGPNYQFRTEVLAGGDMTPEGVLRGDLVLVGGGDPALAREDLAALAASLHASGLRVVEGGLWGDETRYDTLRHGPGWKPRYVTHESGALSALAVDQNAYRNDPGFIADPVTANTDLFREALTAAGIPVHGPTRNGRPGSALRPVASHYSPPLAALIGKMVRESDNFFAEMILKELGWTIGKPTTGGGAENVQSTLRSLGIRSGETHDGSGLSPLNRQSASDAILWLKVMERMTIGPTIRSALAAGCVAPGTLKKRFCGTPGAGEVFGKTGALPGSAVLVGYTRTASGRSVRFSFILAGTESNRQARDAIDRAVMAIRAFPI